jgi:hypothetical protein
LFKEVWSFTKKLFNNKPEAWSVDKLVSLNWKGVGCQLSVVSWSLSIIGCKL